MIAVHILQVAIVASAVAIVKSVRPAYGITDVLVIIAVGMIAGIIYMSSMDRLGRRELKRQNQA